MGENIMEAAAPKSTGNTGNQAAGVCEMEPSKSTGKLWNEWPIMSAAEEDLIARIHRLTGDRWDLISGRLPNRTAEEVERYWRMHERRDCKGNNIHRPAFIRLSPSFKFIMPKSNHDKNLQDQ